MLFQAFGSGEESPSRVVGGSVEAGSETTDGWVTRGSGETAAIGRIRDVIEAAFGIGMGRRQGWNQRWQRD